VPGPTETETAAAAADAAPIDDPRIAEVLARWWGFDRLRPLQAEAIHAALAGRDSLVVMPTGGGKSLCYQLPPLVAESTDVVVSPLVALMKDQVDALEAIGYPAAAIHGGMSQEERSAVRDRIAAGELRLVFAAPERLVNTGLLDLLARVGVKRFAIDEAHCISQWGYDFRTAYLEIALVREWHPKAPVLALTATAIPAVVEDIQQKLGFSRGQVIRTSFLRPNLGFHAEFRLDKELAMLEWLRQGGGSGIVYVRSRKKTQDLARFLSERGLAAEAFHAGLDHELKNSRQDAWQKGAFPVIVATNAFGMGIDKPDVRVVIHLDLPENLESYYQEAGRAGRDGKRCYAAILFHPLDGSLLREKVHQAHPPIEVLKSVYQALANYYQLALGSADHTTFGFDLDDFCKRFGLNPSSTYAALQKLQDAGLIELSESFFRPSRLFFAVDNKKMYEFQVANALYDTFIKSLLRLYGAELFSEFVTIQESQIAKANKLTTAEVKTRLTQLEKMHLLIYEPITDQPQLTFLTPRLDADHLPLDRRKLQERRDLNVSKMEAMINYAEQRNRCRMRVIQEYFDEMTEDLCGICDVCIDRRKRENLATFQDYQQQILYLLRQKPLTADELELAVDPKDAQVFVEVVREMVDDGIIAYDDLWVLHVAQRVG